MTSDIIAAWPKPKPFVLCDGTRLGWSFTSRIEAALKRAQWNQGLPKLQRGYVRLRASDGSIWDVPAKHLRRAFEIDPEASVLLTLAWERADRRVFRLLGMVIWAAMGYTPRGPRHPQKSGEGKTAHARCEAVRMSTY